MDQNTKLIRTRLLMAQQTPTISFNHIGIHTNSYFSRSPLKFFKVKGFDYTDVLKLSQPVDY